MAPPVIAAVAHSDSNADFSSNLNHKGRLKSGLFYFDDGIV